MRYASVGLAALAGIVLLAVMGISVQYASFEPVSFTVTLDPNVPGDAERVWRDDDGVLHVRGDPRSGEVTGDITGTITIMDNLNGVIGTSDHFGTFTITTVEGSWNGRYSGTETGGVITIDWVGDGDGGLKGTKLMGTSVGAARVHEFTGTILDPHG